jgi:hypothetical protein
MNFRDEYPGLPETITRDVAKHLDLDGVGGGGWRLRQRPRNYCIIFLNLQNCISAFPKAHLQTNCAHIASYVEVCEQSSNLTFTLISYDFTKDNHSIA